MSSFDAGTTFDTGTTFDDIASDGSVYSYNGLYTDLSTIVVVGQEGLDELPDIRSGDVGYPQSDGLLAGLDLLGGRTITLSLALAGSAGTPATVLLDQVKQAFSPVRAASRPLVFQWPGQIQRMVNCRPRKLVSTVTGRLSDGVALPVIQLVAADPRIYDANPVPVTGRVGGSLVCVNAGTWATWPTITVRGAVTNPTFTNTTTGASVTVTTATGEADVLVVDMGARSATVNGVSVRASMALVPGWWNLAAGSNTVTVTAAAGTALVTVTYASAWL